jgi:hypothetical protein
MLHIAFADLDQLGEFIVTLLEQHIDVTPVALYIILQGNKTVVDDDYIEHQSSDNKNQNPE